RRLPDTDPPDLEHLAAGARLDQPPALARLEGEPPGPRRGLEQRTWPPPVADLAHEGREGPLRRRRHPQGHIDLCGHASFSTCALKATSCSLHSCSAS